MLDPYTIIAFVSGGGITGLISSFVTLRYATKTPKLDYTDRLGDFWEKQNEKIIARFEGLEKRIDELETMSCERADCKIRIKSIA
jgi:hypothetical protein